MSAERQSLDPEGRARKAQDAMEKYMNPVPPYVANLVEYLNKDAATLPEWERDLVYALKGAVQQRVRDHFEVSAMTRQKFVSMPVETWQEPTTRLFVLNEAPRKIIGYLPKNELRRLDEIVKTPLEEAIKQCRTQLDDMMDQMRASEEDRATLEDVESRETFYFQDLEEHKKQLDHWGPLCEKKSAIIAELEQREEFLEEIEEFENKASGDKNRYKKANSLALADENKFRSYAAKKLKEMDAKAVQLCKQFESDTGRRFEIDGIFYLEMIKEQKFGRAHNPGLSLAKLRPEAIPAAARMAYAGLPASNLVVNLDALCKRKYSLHEAGEETKVIRRSSATPDQAVEAARADLVAKLEVVEAA